MVRGRVRKFLLLVSESGGEMHGFPDGKGPNQGIFLLNIGGQASKSAERGGLSVHYGGSIYLCSRRDIPPSKNIEKSCLSAPARSH